MILDEKLHYNKRLISEAIHIKKKPIKWVEFTERFIYA